MIAVITTVKIAYVEYLVRPAIAPETIVAAVAANIVWKNKSAPSPWNNPDQKNQPFEVSPYINE